ncbi:MAG: two-component regulator propeller domain-containing protein [Balneolaceae bacterium]
MYRLILTLLLIAVFASTTEAQQLTVDPEINKLISYQVGSRMAESVPLQSDLLKAQFAERMSQRKTQNMRMKGAADHPALDANFKQYTPHNTGSNGLSEPFVRFVEEDSKGNLYFSTYGIDKWNGFTWENMNPRNSGLPNANIQDMLEDRNGNLWFATFTGLVRIDAQTNNMQVIQVGSGLRSNLVYTLHESKNGKIFAGHRWNETFGGGVSVLNAGGFVEKTFAGEFGLHGDSIEDFVESDGKLYIATAADPTNGEWGGVNVYSIQGDSIETFYHKDNSDLPYNEVSSLEIDGDGNIWAGFFTNPSIGHTEGGVAMFDGTAWTHFSNDKGNDVGVLVTDLLFDNDGTLWVGATDGAYSSNGTSFAKVTDVDDDGFLIENVGSITELNDGRIAFSKFQVNQQAGGVSILTPEDNTWEHMSSRDGGNNSLVKFGADYDSKGNLWSTGFQGVQKFDGETWETWTAKDGLGDTYGWDLIVDSNDNIWVNTATNGLTRINADGSLDIINEHGTFVESNYEASNGDLWFGDYYSNAETLGSNGLLQYDGTNYTVYDSTDGLPAGTNGAILSIAEDQEGRILAATNEGLFRLEGGTFSKWEYDGYAGYVTKLHLDSNDRLWINGSGGITSMFDGFVWQHFNIYDGVESWVEDIEEDLSGRVWLSQPNGAVVYDNGTFHRVSPKDGVPIGGQVYDLAPSPDDAGKMSFGTYGSGLITMDTELPVVASEITDNPDDQGGWIRVNVDGYLLSQNYTGKAADAWRVEVNVDGNWEAAAPVSPASSKSINVSVPVTKPTGDSPDETNSYEFRIVALDEDTEVIGISEAVTGFAEDNIPPAQVQAVVADKADGNISLSWEAVEDNDVNGYAVYASSVTDFAETEPLGFTSSLSIQLEEDGDEELVVVARDNHNNYGSPSEAVFTSNERIAGLPDDFELKQNYPNPFNPVTKISYALPQSSHTRITVYNSIGQQVATLLNEVKSAGNHEVNFNAEQLNSGMYIYRIEAGSFSQTRKMMLIK